MGNACSTQPQPSASQRDVESKWNEIQTIQKTKQHEREQPQNRQKAGPPQIKRERKKDETQARIQAFVASMPQDTDARRKFMDWHKLKTNMNAFLEANANDPVRLQRAQKAWIDYHGTELEPALVSGSIALLDAAWIVDFYYNQPRAKLPHRQALPPEAFLSMEEIKSSSSKVEGLQIICLSYMWLQPPEHPDPKRSTLKLLVEWLESKLRDGTRQGDVLIKYPKWAVFWDYASLHQHPNEKQGKYRTKNESSLFQDGLRAMAGLFSHPHTYCYKITQFPSENYPAGYNLSHHANIGDYHERGWPFVESAWVSLTKSSTLTIDIGRNSPNAKLRPTAHRLAPLTPTQAEKRILTLTFTNAKVDCPLVQHLYKQEFDKRLGEMTEMHYAALQWKDHHISQLAQVLTPSYVPRLRVLDLRQNSFTPVGCQVLAEALLAASSLSSSNHGSVLDDLDDEDGTSESNYKKLVHQLEKLELNGVTTMGDAGVEALAPALVQVETVGLTEVNMGASGCKALADAAMEEQGTVKLLHLDLLGNPKIGDSGIEYLAPIIVGQLKSICLWKCNIGDDACRALADAAEALSSPSHFLLKVTLGGNPRITKVGFVHLGRLLAKCPNLQTLLLEPNDAKQFGTALKKQCANSKLVVC